MVWCSSNAVLEVRLALDMPGRLLLPAGKVAAWRGLVLCHEARLETFANLSILVDSEVA
jgi:hypothetical protein